MGTIRQNQARKRNFSLMLTTGIITNLKLIRTKYAKNLKIINQINTVHRELKKLISIIIESKSEDWLE